MTIRFRQRCSRYFFVLIWLMRDYIWRYRWRVIPLLGLRFSGTGLQLGTFALLALYARLLETDSAVTIAGTDFRARESVMLLALAGVSALAAMTLGSNLVLLSTRRIETLAAEYERFCSKRIWDLASRSTSLYRPAIIKGGDDQMLMRLAKRYPRFLRRITKSLLTSLLPAALVMCIVMPALFVLNFWLTCIVLALVSLSLYAHYRLSIRAANSSLMMEQTARDAAREYKGVINQITSTLEPLDDASLDRPFQSQAVQRNRAAYYTRVTATNESQFISDCFTAIILTIVLIMLGAGILRDGHGWTSLLIYLLALRYGMAQTKSALSSFAGVNRFFHQVQAYLRFLDSQNESFGSPKRAMHLDQLTVRCEPNQLKVECERELTIRPREAVGICGPFRPTRFQICAMFAVLADDSSETLQAVIANSQLISDIDSLRAFVNERNRNRNPANVMASPSAIEPDEIESPSGLSLVVLSDTLLRDLWGGFETDDEAAPANPLPLKPNEAAVILITKPKWLRHIAVSKIIATDGESTIWIGSPDQAQGEFLEALVQDLKGESTLSDDEDDEEEGGVL
jgi:ABC-type multidrug transport system fused ATPase/permease subunit